MLLKLIRKHGSSELNWLDLSKPNLFPVYFENTNAEKSKNESFVHLLLISCSLTKEASSNATSKQAMGEAREKLRDLERENDILRESNEKLLDSAYNVERERKFVASENALKVLSSEVKFLKLKND